MLQRRNIVVRCSYNTNQKPTVFQSRNFKKSNTMYVSLSEIRDLIDTTKMSRYSDKKDLFESYGLDYDKCKTYIDDVTHLESCYSISDLTLSKLLFTMIYLIRNIVV